MTRRSTAILLAAVLAACGTDASPPPSPSPIVRPAPTPERPRFTQAVSQSQHELLATLPNVAGGEQLDGVRIVDDSLNVWVPVDDILEALQKKRRDAVSVYRYGENAMIGATMVAGVDGARLLEAFAQAWHAPAVIRRSVRVVAVAGAGWELEQRGGGITVVYAIGEVVYVVETQDRALLDAVLLDMPPVGVR